MEAAGRGSRQSRRWSCASGNCWLEAIQVAEARLDCKANIDFAYVLYQERGFAPWTTYNSGAYLKFLHDTY
jgi:hypothetical protein